MSPVADMIPVMLIVILRILGGTNKIILLIMHLIDCIIIV